MLSFECIKNEKSVYFLLTSADTFYLPNMGLQHLKSGRFYGKRACYWVSGNSYDLSAQSSGQHITTGTSKPA